jgi:hypothetical protein
MNTLILFFGYEWFIFDIQNTRVIIRFYFQDSVEGLIYIQHSIPTYLIYHDLATPNLDNKYLFRHFRELFCYNEHKMF